MTISGPAPDTSFNVWLESVCRTRKTNLCVGLDPDCEHVHALTNHPNLAPPDLCLNAMFTAATAAAAYAAAFKPNAAFFESIEEDVPLTTKMGHFLHQNFPDIIAVVDAKRGDIGNSSSHYANAVFQMQQYNAVTVNPLMGYDAVAPFIESPTRGVFLLCLTSNPGADDFLLKNDLYLRIAEKAAEWNTRDNIGLVVGATRPEYLARIREVAPTLPLLIPGIGAQGGKLDETLDAINARMDRRFLINASRSILYPAGATWEGYAEAVAEAAQKLRDDINAHLA